VSDLVSIVNLALEAGRFIRESGDATVTKVIRVADLREAEMVLEFAADQAEGQADRVLAAMVFNRGAGNVAQVKIKGGGFGNFIDRPGPLVVIVGEKTFPHLECDPALWRRLHMRAEPAREPVVVRTKRPLRHPVQHTPTPTAAKPGEMLGGCLTFVVLIGGLGGYAWYRHATKAPPQETTPAIVNAGDVVIAPAPPSQPGLARDVMVNVEIAPSGRVVGARAYESNPEIARAAEMGARHAVFAPRNSTGNETTTITVRFRPR